MLQKSHNPHAILISVTGLLLATLSLLAFHADAEIVWRSKIYLATLDGGKYRLSKTSEFGCDDTIYLFYESADQTLVDEMLIVTWRNRQSNLKHQTSMPFKPKSKGGRLWSWSGIEFNSGGSALDKMTAFLDPAAGREQFIGGWDVQAKVRGKLLTPLEMKVLC